MGETSKLDVRISAYAERNPWWLPHVSRQTPATGNQMAAYFTWARNRGVGMTIIVEGREAEEGAKRVRELVDRPPASMREACNLIGGRGRDAPYSDAEGAGLDLLERGFSVVLEEKKRGLLEKWGLLEDYDRMRGA